jgi:glucose-6-phosphate isomerase
MPDAPLCGPHTREWSQLQARAVELRAAHVRDLVAAQPNRFADFSCERAGLLLDYTRQRLDAQTRDLLCGLADAVDLRGRIEAMWRGEKINRTEDRAVLHVALRQAPQAPVDPVGVAPGGAEIRKLVLEERERMLAFAEKIRTGAIRGSAGEPYALVVNIGIGGSDLGPAMAVEALRPYAKGGPRVAFVSNVGGCTLADLLADADPARTLFIVASKTFTTQETLANARAARAWLAGKIGEAAIPQHFAAVSVNAKAMDEFGVHPEYRFQMWDWVGGRYSMWSSIGVSLAIAIGRAHFERFLAGGFEMDDHFRTAPWRENLPVLAALLGVWNINFLELPTLAVLPYDERLARFPAYLQQLEMESNGKSVTLGGEACTWPTGAVIWGEPGNNAQHSFFQLLHQGTARAALDFLLPARSSCGRSEQHELAIANCLAQAEAFANGQPVEALRAEPPALAAHKVHAGSRPVSIIAFERLDPATLGRLVALYEHKVFAQSVIWGINAFDQWGVELGKKLAAQLVPAVKAAGGGSGTASAAIAAPAAAAPGVRALLERIGRWRSGS